MPGRTRLTSEHQPLANSSQAAISSRARGVMYFDKPDPRTSAVTR
jgi:hypothetical protein